MVSKVSEETRADAYLRALPPVRDLVAAPEVQVFWDGPSALDDMTVGAVTAHLVGTVTQLVDWLRDDHEGEVVTLADWYARARWLTAGVEDESNREIRKLAEENAAPGHEAVLAALDEAIAALVTALPAFPAGRPVFVARRGVAMSLDDILVTRIMELAVHADDLAFSVGLQTPPLGERAQSDVVALLARISIGRHGWPAVLRTLSRAERAPKVGISAF